MRRLGLPALIFAAAAMGFAQAVPDSDRGVTAEERQQGFSNHTLLAKPRAGRSALELTEAESREGMRVRGESSTFDRLRVLEPAAGETIAEAIERLRATGRYEFVEPDYVVTAELAPNDPRYLAADQWGLRNIGQSNGLAGADIRAEEAWDIQSSASNVVVAVIDSGMRTSHEDIDPNLWVNTAEAGASINNNVSDDDGNGYIDDANGINATMGRNVIGNGIPVDALGHGTAVASVIGGAGNNGVGMTGVAWNVKLMALRFLGSSGSGYTSDEIKCIDYAIAKKAQLINASFGGGSFSQALFDALKRARDAGIIVVCSAGNDGSNSDTEAHYPSGYLLDNIVAVANTTRTDVLASSSTYGSGLVDLGAPGTSILVADYAGDHGYSYMSGTSFSAPMVTGALALLKAKFPNDQYRETINRLLRSTDARPGLTGKTATGGRLNISAALRTTTARPFNDDFATRAQFEGESGVIRGAAQFATRETAEPTHAGAAGNGSLWWTWTAPRTGAVTLETSGSAFDTLLAVYTGSALSALTAVASNDDESATVTTSKLTFNATARTTYQFAVDRKGGDAGLVVLRVKLLAANDEFASAVPVTGRSWSIEGDNRSATREAGEPRIKNNAGGHSMWYRWTAPASRRYHVATMSDDFDTMIGVYTGTTVSALAEVASSLTAGDSNVTLRPAAVTFSATAGTTYNIVVDSEASSSGVIAGGAFTLSCIDSEWEAFGYGPFNSPAIAPDGTLHSVDAFGYLYGHNPDGGSKWRYMLTGYGTFSSPAVGADGTVYVGDDAKYVYAVRPDGTRKWRIQTPGIISCSPALASDGSIYIRSDDGRLYALDPETGATRWSAALGSGTATYSSPVVAADGTIYCAASDSKLYAFTPAGVQKWNYATGFIYASPAIASDGTIYLGISSPENKLLALSPNGTLKWQFTAEDGVSSSAAVGTDGTIYFGCVDKNIYAVSSTGQLRWTFRTGGEIRQSSPAIAADGAIYVGCLDGKVYALEPEGTLRRIYAMADEVRSSPLLHQGRLYLTSSDFRLYAIDAGQVPASTAWPMHRQNISRSARPQWSRLGIGVQPRGYTAEVGDVVTLSVGAVGTGPLTYQWFFNGQALAGGTASTYRVDPVTHANGGQYTVRITDATGSITSSAATLAISTPLIAPSIFAAPQSQTVTAGSAVTLSVTAIGTVPMTYQWLRDGNVVAAATGNTLTFTPARLTDTGSYSVVVTNFAGRVTSAAAAFNVAQVSRISNLSIRCQVGGNAGTLTVGLTVGGAATVGEKPLLLRAIGPTLAVFGVDGALADPRLLVLRAGTAVAQNDDWAGNSQVTSTGAAVGAFGLEGPTSKDAALAYSAAAAGYVVQINGAGDGAGIALAEVYDTSPPETFFVSTPRLTNVSALTQAGTDADMLIAGFSIIGSSPKTVLVRAIGPTLAAFGVDGVLADPKLQLFRNGVETAIATNDNWGATANPAEVSGTATKVGAFALPPDSKDAVLLLSLPPGSYTAQVSGLGDTIGVALIEVYEVP